MIGIFWYDGDDLRTPAGVVDASGAGFWWFPVHAAGTIWTWDDAAASVRRCLDPGEIEHPLCTPALGPRRNLGAEPFIESEARPVQFLGWQ